MAFNGLAVYDNFAGIHENVSDLVGFLAPYETPLLDALGTSDRAATNVAYEWLEDTLNPSTDATSAAVGSAGQTVLQVANSGRFRVGDEIRLGSEVLLVNSTYTGTLSVTRGYGGTTASTYAAGAAVDIIGNAALEGEDTDEDFSRAKVRRANYLQIFKKGVKVSGTARAVNWIGASDPLAYQKVQRMRELLRDLEKTVIHGRAGVSTIGSDTARRTLAGLLGSLSTNIQSWGTLTGSLDNAPVALSNALQLAFSRGSKDIDLIAAPAAHKVIYSTLNASRTEVVPLTVGGRTFEQMVDVYNSDFGRQRIVLCRWLPSNLTLLLDSSRIKLVPLQGRTFQYEDLAKTGDSDRGQLVGEYTLELRNEDAHAVLQTA